MNITNLSFYKKIFTALFNFSISSYLSLLIISLMPNFIPYNNISGVIGPIAHLSFNPLNNFLRYGVFIILVPLVFSTFSRLKNKKLRRLIFLVILLSLFFLSQTGIYSVKFKNLDMFHDGERLAGASDMYYYHKTPYTGIFFLHGAFADPGLAYVSFKLFKPSIGSYFLSLSILQFLTLALFLLFIFCAIEDDFLYFSGSFLFLLTLYTDKFFPYRDLPFIFYFLILSRILSEKVFTRGSYGLLFFLSGLTFYYSIDKGYFLVGANIVIALMLLIRAYKNKYIVPAILFSALGMIGTAIVGVFLFGVNGFREFVNITFFELPKIKPYLDEYVYPTLNPSNFAVFWLPIIWMAGLVTIFLTVFKSSWKDKKVVLFLGFLLFTLFSFRSPLGRADIEHVHEIIHLIVISSVLLLDIIFRNKKMQKLSYAGIFLFFFCLLPFMNLSTYFAPFKTQFSDLKIFFSLPSISDDYWLKTEVSQVKNYISDNTNSKDSLFVFTNEPAYYYILNRYNPTRFYAPWFAATTAYQKEVVQDLTLKPPKYIIYKSNNDTIDIPNTVRVAIINSWIRQNYKEEITIGTTQILKHL